MRTDDRCEADPQLNSRSDSGLQSPFSGLGMSPLARTARTNGHHGGVRPLPEFVVLVAVWRPGRPVRSGLPLAAWNSSRLRAGLGLTTSRQKRDISMSEAAAEGALLMKES